MVKTDSDARELIMNSVRDGWEPHFVVIYDDVKHELCALAEMLGMEINEY